MNVYEIITDRILESLKNGVVPWKRPWRVDAPKNLVSGKAYRGVNVLLLQSAPYDSPHWLTFNQARNLGGSVKKGERGCPVIFWKVSEREDKRKTREKSFLLRYYTVFNVRQTEGIEIPEVSTPKVFDPIAECVAVVNAYKDPPSIVHVGGQACYMPALDRIWMPKPEQFNKPAEYYSTLFHELSHSTGAANRLARKGVVDPSSFASHTYSFEELVAECASAFLAAHAGISSEVIDNSAAYIGSWSRKLRSEPKWIVNASAQAAKAADLILGKLPQANAESTDQAA